MNKRLNRSMAPEYLTWNLADIFVNDLGRKS